MTRIVLLNNVDHGDLTVATGYGRAFGDAVNQVLVFPTEWQDVQREYPILFRRSEGGQYQSVALVGLDRDENLFLEGDDWRARYVPALHRRGPFSIGVQRSDDGGEDEPMIHVDLDHPRIASSIGQAAGMAGGQGTLPGPGPGPGQGTGRPVFLPHGGNSPYLDTIADVLRRIHEGVLANEPMFEAFEVEGLIEPVAVEIMLDETTKYTLDDLYTISVDRLGALDGAALQRLHSRGVLEAAFWVIASLGTVPHLIERKTARLSER